MNASAVLLLHFFLGTISNVGVQGKENEYVKVDVALASDSLRVGGQGAILVRFTPADGIHITVDPSVEVRIQKNPVFVLREEPDFSTDKESGFLSTFVPVRQKFSVSHKTKPGRHTLKGTIVYYFCSDAEGWCRKSVQPITLTLNVAQR